MILTGRSIKWYLETGLLKIDPVKPEQFQPAALDLYVHPVSYCCVTELEHSIFHHGHSHLFRGVGYFEMPLDLMAFVCIRSSWARRGLLPPDTHIDPGFKGEVTIELFNGGQEIIFKDPSPQRIISLIFCKTDSPAEPYKGKYQGQRGITLAKKDVK